ncbi:MAG: general secretion pathway protein L [Alphaproteobacteria bacterium]|jgi:general secretion pathway protein L
MIGSESSTATTQDNALGLKRFLDGWLLELASLVWSIFGFARRRPITLHKSSSGIAIFSGRDRQLGNVISEGDDAKIFAHVGSKLKAARLSRSDLVVQLADDQVLLKQLTFPLVVRDVLDPVVRNQLHSLVPWSGDATCFGYRIVGQAGDKISVSLAAVHEDQIVAMQRHATAAQMSLSRIETVGTDEKSVGVTLFDTATEMRKVLARTIGRALGLLAIAALLSGAIGIYQWSINVQADTGLADTIKHVRRELAGHAKGRTKGDKVVQQLSHLTQLKSRNSMSLSLLDALSAALPDQAHLSNLSTKNGTLTISGRADDAAALISSLEQSGRFKSVRFVGPTIRAAKGQKETFSIEAKVSGSATLLNLTEGDGNDR